MGNNNKVNRVALVIKYNQPHAIRIADSLSAWLQQRGRSVCVYENAEPGVNGFVGGEDCLPSVDLVIVLGGDGTLLSAARKIRGLDPILGVNLGGLGFLTEFSLDELYPMMDRILEGRFDTEPRTMLKVQVYRDNTQVAECNVLNDAVINKAALARMIRLHTSVDGEFLNTFRSDGLIVSSPTGSTAYNLSAGGPILYPTLECVTLAPICPFMLTNRPIILPDSKVIEIQIGSKARDVTLTFDGQVGFDLMPMDVVRVRKAENQVRLVRSPWTNYFQILRTRLKWGDIK